MLALRKVCLFLSVPAALGVVVGILLGSAAIWSPCAVVAAVGFALGLGAVPSFKGYQYTAWIIAAVVAAMIYPGAFTHWGDLNLRNKWLLLGVVQLVMFGMGTQMSLHDFSGVFKTPRGVVVGIVCHFSVMPLVGYGLTRVFSFPPEIAAGVILIGSCSSGLASNVMAYIARSNLVLSVTVTAITTLVAPFMTPVLMKLLAGTLVEVKFVNMMVEIVKIVIVPITAALLHDGLKRATPGQRRAVFAAASVGALVLLALPLGGWDWLAARCDAGTLLGVELSAFAIGALVFGALYHVIAQRFASVDRFMPLASMAGIVYFTTVTTAAGRENLLKVGALLFLVSVIHNAAGYFFGYWLSRVAGLDKSSSRSVAFEVGLQNGGMASGLAGAMGKLGTVGLAPAVFSPWMNISGSILANYWRRRPVDDGSDSVKS
jgi:bile acid:Na+ symporter, BASS family